MDESKAALSAGMMTFNIIFSIALYIWMAICLQTIAKKTNTPNRLAGLDTHCQYLPVVHDRR